MILFLIFLLIALAISFLCSLLEAALLWGDAWVGAVGFVVTILILIFSEIIPKTLGVAHAKALASFVARTIPNMILIGAAGSRVQLDIKAVVAK
ncbi:MAG: DUF21 domain-containing protein [Phycisphaerae bacterium]|jgi:Mg2+/Co2+ transporter CorB|nr:DUF21 domain-containing protein [Phycisphaerae bacterium]